MKPDFSWVPSRCQALIWGQRDYQDGQDPCPPEDYILVMGKATNTKKEWIVSESDKHLEGKKRVIAVRLGGGGEHLQGVRKGLCRSNAGMET